MSERLEDYRRDGTIYTSALTDAVICRDRIQAGPEALSRLRDEVLVRYREYLPELWKLAGINDAIGAKVREFSRKHWIPTLKPYYAASTKRGHRGEGDGFVVLLWGSAGRVLVAVRDLLPQGQGKFGGAWVSMSFDESSDDPDCCGLQGLCATQEEALALLDAVTERLPEMVPDDSVTIGL